MKRIFSHKNYPTIMYVFIMIFLISIFFSFINLFNYKMNLENKITASAITNPLETIDNFRSNIFYYFVLIIQIFLIFMILNNLKIKKYDKSKR